MASHTRPNPHNVPHREWTLTETRKRRTEGGSGESEQGRDCPECSALVHRLVVGEAAGVLGQNAHTLFAFCSNVPKRRSILKIITCFSISLLKRRRKGNSTGTLQPHGISSLSSLRLQPTEALWPHHRLSFSSSVLSHSLFLLLTGARTHMHTHHTHAQLQVFSPVNQYSFSPYAAPLMP